MTPVGDFFADDLLMNEWKYDEFSSTHIPRCNYQICLFFFYPKINIGTSNERDISRPSGSIGCNCIRDMICRYLTSAYK